MAVGHADRPRRRWLDALFGEARELGRRRHRRQLFLVLIAGMAAAALALGLHEGGGSGAGAPGHAGVRISSAALPLHGNYHALATIGHRLVLTGGAAGGVPWLTGRCSAVDVDPVTLRVSSTVRGDCADPRLYGRRVLPVGYVARRGSPLFELGLRIAVVAPHTHGGYRLGPVVLRYPQCSDCGVEWIYGDGSLWIYAPWAAPAMKMTDRSGELFRVSERTGRVIERWPMPSFTRSLLAVDDDGVWIAQSLFGGRSAHMSPRERGAYSSLYRVSPGLRAPAREFDVGTGAYWMAASGHDVWLDLGNGRTPSRLWSLRGPAARPMIRHRSVASGFDCAEMGEGQPSTAGSARTGMYCIELSETGGVLRGFDAVSGAPSAVPIRHLGTDPVSALDSGPGPAVVLGRSVYFLIGEDRLFRVAT